MWNSLFTEDFLAVLKRRDYCIFTVAQMISQFGEKLHHIVLISLVGAYAHGSPSALASLGVTFTLPAIIFAPVVGILVDRWNRKWILVVSDGLRFVVVAFMPFIILGVGRFSVVYPLVFAVFLLALFFNTSKLAVIPDLVPKEKLLAANSVSLFVIRLATVCGMVLGGYLVGWTMWQSLQIRGWQAGFFINALLFLLSAIFFTRIHFAPKHSSSQNPGSFISDLKNAYGIVLKERVVFFVMVSAFLLCTIGATIYVLVINLVQQQLGKGTAGIGLMAGTLALGSLMSAVLYSSMGRRLPRTKVICTCLILVGILLIFFSAAETTFRLVILSFLGGIFLAPIPIAQDTLLHEHLSERTRGRIFGIRNWIINLFFALGCWVLGLMSLFMTTRAALVCMGGFIGISTITLLLVSVRSECETSSWV